MQDDRSLTRREFRQRQDGESAQRLQRSRRETTGPGESATQTAAREGRADRSQQRSSMSLSPDQRSRFAARLSDRLEPMNVQPIPRSEISASIGRAIPRSVRLHRLPPDVISIYPQFRGYSFVLVENEFVIVEPGSRRVVAMIPRSGVGYASRETTGFSASGRLRLSSNQRRVIRTTVLHEPSCHYEQRVDFFLFMPFPRTVEICEFPRRVIAEVPEIRGYRYAVYGNDVVVVDPNEDSVIEIIR